MQIIPVYEKYIEGYLEWKKDRKTKHEQTKALRKAKVSSKNSR